MIISEYINATVKSPAMKYSISFERSDKSANKVFSPKGCTIAPTNFKISENEASKIIGPIISNNSINSPHNPTELLMSNHADISISNPLDKKFPTIGTELLTAYFVALKNMPSNSDEAEL